MTTLSIDFIACVARRDETCFIDDVRLPRGISSAICGYRHVIRRGGSNAEISSYALRMKVNAYRYSMLVDVKGGNVW
jgi:hypothetical protein